MLTKDDIKFIKNVREDVRENRKYGITIKGEYIAEENPITGELIEEPYEEEIEAVITEVSVRTSVDRYLDSGIEVRTGDVIIDISIGDMPDEIDNKTIKGFDYDGKSFTVISSDKLGLGGYNRVEVIGRRDT